MSKKKGNKSSKKQKNNGAFSPPPQNIALGLVRRAFPELLSNVLTDVRPDFTPMTPEEREKWEKEYAKRWKENHINDIKHSGDFWKL